METDSATRGSTEKGETREKAKGQSGNRKLQMHTVKFQGRRNAAKNEEVEKWDAHRGWQQENVQRREGNRKIKRRKVMKEKEEEIDRG